MAVPVRTMPPQLALALRHRSHCQLALRGGCSARERNKRVHFSSPTDWTRAQNQQHPMNNLLKAPQVTQHPSPGHFFSILSSFLYFWPNKGSICLLNTLGFLFLTERALSSCVYFIQRRSTRWLRGQQGHGSASPQSLTSCTSLTALGTSQLK